MKRIFLFIIIISGTLVVAGTLHVAAQVTAIAGVGVSIITPISIIKNVDMNFGNASVSGIAGGSIILAPGGARSIAGTGVTLPATTGTIAAAAFTVNGVPGFSYAITLPLSAVISGPGVASMTVNGFTSSPSGTGMLGTGGSQSLSIGATLTLAAAQAPGMYTNATSIPVTVNYN